ncbi:MAG: hypothetical protein TREMPRED_004470 [Tremellales sp. Tagirdzhanova-0007]|nr:MAG: hypothetical protein TREMPRED_004470 [Tremellales sp. Tagirdzhanova-0007]
MDESSKTRKLSGPTETELGSGSELPIVLQSLGTMSLAYAKVRDDRLSYPISTISLNNMLHAKLSFVLPTMVTMDFDPSGRWMTAKITADPSPSGSSQTKALIHLAESDRLIQEEKKNLHPQIHSLDKFRVSFHSLVAFLECSAAAGDRFATERIILKPGVKKDGTVFPGMGYDAMVFTKSTETLHRTYDLGETLGDLQEQARLVRGDGSYVLETILAHPSERERKGSDEQNLIHQLDVQFRYYTRADELETRVGTGQG